MKIWYILMTFPSPAQPYAANDVRTVIRLGNEVAVHALRGRRRDADQLLTAWGLDRLDLTHAAPSNIIRGLLISMARPLRTARAIAWIVRQSGGQAVHLVKGLALLPRALALLHRLERERPDVVHIYWGHYPAVFGWLVLNFAPGVVVSLSLSAGDLLCGFPGSIAVAQKAHLVTTWAGVNVPELASRGVPAEAVHVFWQGLDLEKVSGRRFVKTPFRIVTASRLVAEKGMDDVIRAFSRVVAAHPRATLVVLGDGPDRPRLERLAGTLGIQHVVSFRGHVSHGDVFEELAGAEVFLLLSHYDGERLPNVVKEAMACQCFVVTTATPGIDELLKDGTHGRVVPLGEWEHAARLVMNAFADPHTTAAMAGAAQSYVLENFDLLGLIRRLVQTWEAKVASVEASGHQQASVSSYVIPTRR